MVGGPYCCKLLADLGATVIKVEPPGGDVARQIPPFLSGSSEYGGALFLYCNGNKKSVTVDDSTAMGRKVLWQLIEQTDVFVTDARGSELEVLGLGEAEVRSRWPGLVFASIRPFGLSGPLAERSAHELNVFHAGGEGKLLPGGLGYKMFPDRPPIRAGRYVSGFDSGAVAATLILAALIRRHETGVGDFIDISQQDVEISLNRVNADAQLNAGMPLSRAHRGYDFGGIFACKQGYIAVRPIEDRHWAALARGIGREDLIEDPRFVGRQGRQENGEQIQAILQDYCLQHTASDIFERVSTYGTPIGYVADARALFESRQLRSRAWFHGTVLNGTSIELPGAPFKMSLTPTRRAGRSPQLGEHTKEVLENLGQEGHLDARRDKVPIVPGQGLLSGFRIVDATWAGAGPYSTETMALLGAEVIKIESSTHPDLVRRVVGQAPGELNRSTRFNTMNMRKQSLRLNLQTPGGMEVFRRLVATSDAFVENFRPGVTDRLGIAYEQLIKIRPDLIMVSISAAGRGGPESDQPGYATIFNAMGGLAHMTGYKDGPPTEVRDSVDLRVGTVAALALTAALFHRKRTGQGQWVDISAREVVASVVGDALVEYALTGTSPTRSGNDASDFAPHGVFQCAGRDSWVAIAVTNDSEWGALCRALGRPELLKDSRFVSRRSRFEHAQVLEELISEWTRNQTPSQALARCLDAGVPISQVMDAVELLQDHHVRAREVIQEVQHPLMGALKVIRGPWRLGSGDLPLASSPLIGEHTARILLDVLRLDSQEIARLEEEGALE